MPILFLSNSQKPTNRQPLLYCDLFKNPFTAFLLDLRARTVTHEAHE